ncbi:MAG: tetratricopeptide repeat protein [Pseudomonadota bacterium]
MVNSAVDTHEKIASGSSSVGRRKFVFILGMHRSGTSALTRMLNILGLGTAENLVEGNAFNVSGYWEPEAVLAHNDHILALADRAWFDPKPIADEFFKGERFDKLVETAQTILQSDFPIDGDIVLKDPRVSRTFPIWKEAVRRVGGDVVCIFAGRAPAECAQSIKRRDEIEDELGLLLYQTYLLEAEYWTRAVPRAMLLYDDLLTDWRACLMHLDRELGTDYSSHSDQTAQMIDQFLTPSARHHRTSKSAPDEGEGSGEYSSPEPIYSLMRSGHFLSDTERLDQLRTNWEDIWKVTSPKLGPSKWVQDVPAWHLKISTQRLQDGDRKGAICYLRQVIDGGGGKARLCHRLGLLLLEDKAFEEAERLLGKAATLSKDRPEYTLSHSMALAKLDRLKPALAAAQKAISMDSERPGFHIHYGHLARRLGDDELAERAFLTAIALAPAPVPYSVLSQIYHSRHDQEKALNMARHAIACAPDDAAYRFRLGKLLDSVGRYKEALQTYGEAIEMDPENTSYRTAKARLEYKQMKLGSVWARAKAFVRKRTF